MTLIALLSIFVENEKGCLNQLTQLERENNLFLNIFRLNSNLIALKPQK